MTKIRTSPLFLKIGLCSASSMESSRRDLLINMTEHKPILKNNQNTFRPRFGFTPKTGIGFPKRMFIIIIIIIIIVDILKIQPHNVKHCLG